MPNIYLKVTIEKNWHNQNFNFLGLKNLSPGQFLGSFNSCKYYWIFKPLVETWKWEVWEQNREWLFYYFNFERNFNVLKSENTWILLNKNINCNKKESDWKMENPTYTIRETNLVFQLIEESQIKSKTLMSWS